MTVYIIWTVCPPAHIPITPSFAATVTSLKTGLPPSDQYASHLREVCQGNGNNNCTSNHTQQRQTICISFIQCWTNVKDVGPTLYKWYRNVMCLLGRRLKTMAQCRVNHEICWPSIESMRSNDRISYFSNQWPLNWLMSPTWSTSPILIPILPCRSDLQKQKAVSAHL